MPIARQLDATHGLHSAPLLDVFIAAFFESVVHIARGGLLRLYREHEADITVVRGRVMIHRQVTALIDRRDVVACRFDDLTVDNRWNQVLKTALEEIRPYIQSADLLRRWIELFALFDEVASIEVDSRLFDRLVFDRHANRYKVAIEWARWIIATLSPEISAGPNSAPGLLFDMNVLFQEYIASAIRYQSNRLTECSVKTQDRGRFLARVPSTGATAFALRPDIVLRQHGREVAVADTKWKLVERTASGFIRPAEADMYQMHAYASRYECEHFALIYPWHAGLTGARETSFKLPPSDGREPVVYVVCIELKPSEDQVRFGGSAPMIGALLGARTPANRSDRGRASATS